MNVRVLQQGASAAGFAESPMAELLARPMAFNPDAYHVMQQRDEALIRDQVLHGHADKSFVYSFAIQGKTVTGISVVGARELASKYGGIKARIVATVEKRGALFIFRTFSPLTIETRQLHDLGDEEDYYECVMEIQDIKSGNSIEVRKKEMRRERTREGKIYERPHYDVIAESKAYRNGVLAILPQNVINDFEQRCIKVGNVSQEKTIDQLRDGAMAFATKHGISLDRRAMAALTYDELRALGQTAKDVPAFRDAVVSMGLAKAQQEDAPAEPEKGKRKAKDPESGPPTLTAADLIAQLRAATDQKELYEIANLIDDVTDPAQRAECVIAFNARLTDLTSN